MPALGTASPAATMLALQRSIGNRRTAALVTRADRRQIARKFGFELELGVPLTAREPPHDVNGKIIHPKHDDVDRVATATGGEFEIKVDHSKRVNQVVPMSARIGPGLGRAHDWERQTGRTLTDAQLQQAGEKDSSAPIMELVSEPFDELTMTPKQVSDKMQVLVDFATEVKAKTQQFAQSYPLGGLAGIKVVPKAALRNWVGADVGAMKANVMSLGAYVQQTYGVSLRRIKDEFTERANQPGSKLTQDNKTALSSAVADGDHMVQWLKDRYSQKGSYTDAHGVHSRIFSNKRKIAGADTDPVQGFFTLMAYYLRMGTVDKQVVELFKKRVGIFYYKTQLSTLRNSLAAGDPGLKWVFKERREKIRDELLARTGRRRNEGVLQGPDAAGDSELTVGRFVDQVLKGESDPFFAGSKNPWSSELTAPSLGMGTAQGLGVVIENRKYAATTGKTEVMGKVDPTAWVQMALDLYNHLRRRHDVPGAPALAPAVAPVIPIAVPPPPVGALPGIPVAPPPPGVPVAPPLPAVAPPPPPPTRRVAAG